MQVIWLRAFVAAAETGSIVRAAHQLARPQSRVSAYIAQLEEDFGVTVLDRGKRPLALTVAGELLLGHAREALRALDAARTDFEHLSGRRFGTVRLACIPSIAGAYAPALINRYTREEPGIAIQMHEAATSTIARIIVDGQADLAIVPAAYISAIPEIASTPLWREPLVAILAHSHPRAQQDSVAPSEITGEVLITAGSAEGGRGLSPEVAPLFAAEDAPSLSTRRVASPHTLVALVRRGGAVGITNPLALELTGSEGIVARPLAAAGAERTVVLAWRRGRELSSHSAALRSFIEAAAPPPSATRA